jgi:hypothetical protein
LVKFQFGHTWAFSSENKYLLKFQDELSKYTVAAPMPQQDPMPVARIFVEEIALKFGIPQVILTV